MNKPITLMTIGYQGAELAPFISTLKQAGVECLVDVRENANSRKRGFSKSALAEALRGEGIQYNHLRGLGTPPEMRKAYRANNDMAWFAQAYRQFLATRTEDMQELAAMLPQSRCCLMCFEADPAECHRSLIAQELTKEFEGKLEIEHLRIAPAMP